MKVRDLIDLLDDMPQELEVVKLRRLEAAHPYSPITFVYVYDGPAKELDENVFVVID